MKLLKNILSIEDSNCKKVIRLFGIKLEFKNKYLMYENELNKIKSENKRLQNQLSNQESYNKKLSENVIRYLTDVNFNPIENDCCPFCGSKKYTVEKEYSINYLMERWKQEYHFVPFAPCYVDRILERRVCSVCGLIYYNYRIPDTEEFYSILSELHEIYSKNKWDYDVAMDIVKEYRPKSLLDIGCGYGFFIEKSKEYVADVRGSEFNPVAIKELNKKGITVYDKDLTELTDTFDMITAFQVLEHVVKPDEFIENLLNLLNKDGLLLLVTPNPESELIKYAPGILELPPHHNLDISKEFYEFIASRYDLEIISYIQQDVEFWVYRKYMWGRYDISVNQDNEEDFSKFMQEKEGLIGKGHAVLYRKK